MIRVLLVGKGEPERGGIPTFLATLLESDLAEIYDIDFLNVAHSGTPEGGRASRANLRRTASDALAVWRRSRDRDVVHIHSALAPLVTLLRGGTLVVAARAGGARVVLHAHGGLIELWLTTRPRRTTARLALAGADRIAAVSEGGRAALEDVLGSRRVVTIANGVDTETFRPAAQLHHPPRILYAGLLTPRKGVVDLIRASEVLRERGLDHELWLAGGTPDEGPAAEAEVQAAAGAGVRLLGPIPREAMPDVYRQVDIFCLPSWWEAAPLSILEAMASGLAVVATSVGDVPRMVSDGQTGFVVPSRDGGALADALGRLLSDAELRRSCGEAGRRRACDAFSSTNTSRAIAALYDEIAR